MDTIENDASLQGPLTLSLAKASEKLNISMETLLECAFQNKLELFVDCPENNFIYTVYPPSIDGDENQVKFGEHIWYQAFDVVNDAPQIVPQANVLFVSSNDCKQILQEGKCTQAFFPKAGKIFNVDDKNEIFNYEIFIPKHSTIVEQSFGSGLSHINFSIYPDAEAVALVDSTRFSKPIKLEINQQNLCVFYDELERFRKVEEAPMLAARTEVQRILPSVFKLNECSNTPPEKFILYFTIAMKHWSLTPTGECLNKNLVKKDLSLNITGKYLAQSLSTIIGYTNKENETPEVKKLDDNFKWYEITHFRLLIEAWILHWGNALVDDPSSYETQINIQKWLEMKGLQRELSKEGAIIIKDPNFLNSSKIREVKKIQKLEVINK